MGTTANLDLPYPDPTDPMANTDLYIKALADQLETIGFVCERGTGTTGAFGTNPSTLTTAINFTVGRFSAAPYVFAMLRGVTAPNNYAGPSVNVGSSSTANIYISRIAGAVANVDFHWLAVGVH